ncbi:MAG: hypothetical protein ACRELX_19200, partial [Longimicrobiales bacterium]
LMVVVVADSCSFVPIHIPNRLPPCPGIAGVRFRWNPAAGARIPPQLAKWLRVPARLSLRDAGAILHTETR